jgi:hypothetical protein
MYSLDTGFRFVILFAIVSVD